MVDPKAPAPKHPGDHIEEIATYRPPSQQHAQGPAPKPGEPIAPEHLQVPPEPPEPPPEEDSRKAKPVVMPPTPPKGKK